MMMLFIDEVVESVGSDIERFDDLHAALKEQEPEHPREVHHVHVHGEVLKRPE